MHHRLTVLLASITIAVGCSYLYLSLAKQPEVSTAASGQPSSPNTEQHPAGDGLTEAGLPDAKAAIVTTQVASRSAVLSDAGITRNDSVTAALAYATNYFELAGSLLADALAGDPDAQYAVAKAAGDCEYYLNVAARAERRQASRELSTAVESFTTLATERLATLCGDFQLQDRNQRQVLREQVNNMLEQSAENGQPAAAANRLFNEARSATRGRRSLNAEQWSQLDDLAVEILESGDPYAVRKLSDYFSLRQRERPGDLEVPEHLWFGSTPDVANFGLELASCVLGYPCQAESPHVLATCLELGGGCDPNWDYTTVLAEARLSPLAFQDALQYRDWVLGLIREGNIADLVEPADL